MDGFASLTGSEPWPGFIPRQGSKVGNVECSAGETFPFLVNPCKTCMNMTDAPLLRGCIGIYWYHHCHNFIVFVPFPSFFILFHFSTIWKLSTDRFVSRWAVLDFACTVHPPSFLYQFSVILLGWSRITFRSILFICPQKSSLVIFVL